MRTILYILPVILGLNASAKPAAPNPFLRQAKEHYEAFQFAECLQRLVQARQWPSTAQELVQTELYAGLCSASSNQLEAAHHHFMLAREADPEVKLPKYTSPKIVELFEKAKPTTPPPPPASLIPEPKAEPAAVSPFANRPEASPRWPRWLVAGLLGGTSLVLATIGVWSGVRAKDLERQANTAAYEFDRTRLGVSAQASAVGANVLFAAATAGLVAALLVLVVPAPEAPPSRPLAN